IDGGHPIPDGPDRAVFGREVRTLIVVPGVPAQVVLCSIDGGHDTFLPPQSAVTDPAVLAAGETSLFSAFSCIELGGFGIEVFEAFDACVWISVREASDVGDHASEFDAGELAVEGGHRVLEARADLGPRCDDGLADVVVPEERVGV